MYQAYAFLAEGFEEVECLAVIDLLRRAGIDMKMVSVSGQKTVTGSHHIPIVCDTLLEETDFSSADLLFLPGGGLGTKNLTAHEGLAQILKAHAAKGNLLSAICAAPSVLGLLGLLNGKKATCYPGFEEKLEGAIYQKDGVVADGNIVTARGLGFAIDLGLKLIALIIDQATSDKIKSAIQYE